MIIRRFIGRADVDELRSRCAAADRLVERYAAARAKAEARYIEERDLDRFAELEEIEQLLFLAEYRQQSAHRDLERALAPETVVASLLARLTSSRR